VIAAPGGSAEQSAAGPGLVVGVDTSDFAHTAVGIGIVGVAMAADAAADSPSQLVEFVVVEEIAGTLMTAVAVRRPWKLMPAVAGIVGPAFVLRA
jgi:hypothetical protein